MQSHYVICAVTVVSFLPVTSLAGEGVAPEPQTYYVGFVEQGPKWVKGLPIREQVGFAEHHANAERLLASGALLMAGPFGDEGGGGIFILKAESEDEARQTLSGDPWLAGETARVVSLRPWVVGLSACQEAATASNSKYGDDRVLSKEVIVRATLDEVWKCWTTAEGMAKFFSPESKIEMRVGGPYELYMSTSAPDSQGRRGTQGCKVLSFIPGEMLSFEWNFPPAVAALRESDTKTHVVLRFRDLGDGRVEVKFDQLGWQEGPDWDKGYEYFDKAWSWVLNNLKEKLEGKAAPAGDAH
jgi:uncharacterized protein YndB with AHSA1/START domain/uncharacterized protein YciI